MKFAAFILLFIYATAHSDPGAEPPASNKEPQAEPNKIYNIDFFINMILGICALSIAVNSGLTISSNIRSSREQHRQLKNIRINAENRLHYFHESLDSLLKETEDELREFIIQHGRAHNIKRELYSKDGYDPDLLYDDIRRICLKPDERFSHVYQIIVDKANEQDLKIPAIKALALLAEKEKGDSSKRAQAKG